MKKEFILIVFPTLNRGQDYFNSNILPLMADFKKINNTSYITDKYELRIGSLHSSDNMRGLNPSLVFLSEDSTMKDYNFILELVRGDHRKIKVVN